MSLLERAQHLSLEVRELNGLKKRAEQAALLEKRANDLEAPATQLRQLDPSIAVLLDLGERASFENQTVAALKSRINDLQSRYLLDKNVMLDPFPKEDIRFVLNRALEQLPSKSTIVLLEAWANWARRQLPPVDDEVLTLLEKITALREAVLAVKRLKQEAHLLSSSLPPDKDATVRLTSLATAIGETWHNLTGDGVPPAVLAFLRKAISIDGAKLQDMSPEVLDWMSEHSLSNSLRIRVG